MCYGLLHVVINNMLGNINRESLYKPLLMSRSEQNSEYTNSSLADQDREMPGKWKWKILLLIQYVLSKF